MRILPDGDLREILNLIAPGFRVELSPEHSNPRDSRDAGSFYDSEMLHKVMSFGQEIVAFGSANHTRSTMLRTLGDRNEQNGRRPKFSFRKAIHPGLPPGYVHPEFRIRGTAGFLRENVSG